MSAIAAVAPSAMPIPTRRSTRRRSSADSAIITGPRKRPYMIGTLWVDFSCSSGNSRIPVRGIPGWKTSPLWAAS